MILKEDINALVKFMVDEVGVEVPLHFTRFFPEYQLTNLPPTEVRLLKKAQTIAKEAGIKYVYIKRSFIRRRKHLLSWMWRAYYREKRFPSYK